MAYVIAVLNQKGGVGKSTLSTNLSTDYARRGRKTPLADADSQGTARNWRSAGRPVYVDTFGGNPYDGTVTFTVRAAGDATAADMDASLAWAMLDEIGPQLYGGICIFSHTPPTRRAAVPESGWGRSTPSILNTPWDCAGRRKTLPSSEIRETLTRLYHRHK